MPTSVGQLTINLGANTQAFTFEMNRAQQAAAAAGINIEGSLKKLSGSASDFGAKMRSASDHSVSGVQATSGALRVLEGNMQNNLRAAERFLANTLGLGEALKTIFPAVGAIALLGVLSELVTRVAKVREALKAMEEAPKRITMAFDEINGPLRVANDELAVANDKLAIHIAKLEGKHGNGLKLALDEARLAADKLAGSLGENILRVQKLVEKEQVPFWQRLLGKADTSDITKSVKEFQDKLSGIRADAEAKVYASADKGTQKNAYTEMTDRQEAALKKEISDVRADLARREKLQHETRSEIATSPYGMSPGAPTTQVKGQLDQAAGIALEKGRLANLIEEANRVAQTKENEKLTKQVDTLEKAPKEKASDPFGDRMNELRAKLTEARALAAAPVGDTLAAALAKGFGEATKAISETNKQLEEHKRKLTLGQQLAITGLASQIALTEAGTRTAQKRAAMEETLAQGNFAIGERLRQEADAEVERLTKIQEKIAEIRAETKGASLGPEAAWQAKYNAMPTATPEDAAKKELAGAQHDDSIVKTIEQLKRETEATRILTAAENLGVDAKRRAILANIAASKEREDLVAAKTAQAQAGFESEDKGSLRGYGFGAGVQRTMQDLQNSVKSTGQMVHEVLGGAFSSLTDTIAGMVAGQKVSWSSLFSGIAAQIAKLGLNNLFGKLGGLFSSASSGGGGGGGLSALVGALFGGGKASGGSVDPGKAYLVGENGPEIWSPPGGGGSIIPNNKLGGGGASYYIDARGANEADVDMRVQRALVQVHGSAVRTSTAAQMEARARRPRSKF